MGKFLKIKTLIPLLIFFLCSVSQSYSQNIVSFSKLKERDNKLYLGEQVFSGFVVKTFITNQPKSITEIKDGNISGKVVEFIEDLSFVSYAYRDTAIINNINSQILFKKQELEKAIQDTVKTSKEQYDFLNYEIGGSEKLLKLKEKDAEGKLKKNKKEIYDKYDQFVQTNKQCIRKFNDIQLQINKLNQQIKSENDKRTYIPKKSLEYNLLNSLKEGKAIIYDSLGNKFGEGEFLNDKQNGLWTYYYPSQSKLAQGNFISGDGGDNGSSGVPKNGREGQWVFYHKNGKISEDAIYKNGKLNGIRKVYFENGNIEEEASYLDGKLNGIRKVYFENGTIEKDLFYKDGILDGSQKEYFKNGNLEKNVTYTNGQASHFIYYYENGSIWSEVDYKFNKKNGVEIIYNPEGLKLSEHYYKNGKQNGLQTTFFQNGFKESEATFVNDKLHGPLKLYYDNGKIKLESFADTLSKNEWGCSGILNSYDENGKLIEKVEVSRNGDVKQLFKQKSEFELNIEKERQSKHICSWCGKSFLGLGFEASDNTSLGMGKTCKSSAKMFVLIPELEKYFCSAKCAFEECSH